MIARLSNVVAQNQELTLEVDRLSSALECEKINNSETVRQINDRYMKIQSVTLIVAQLAASDYWHIGKWNNDKMHREVIVETAIKLHDEISKQIQ